MNIKVYNKELKKAHLIAVEGELDVYTSPQLKEEIAGALTRKVCDMIIDMNGVRYIDSTGLGVLIGTLKRVRELNQRIVLVCNVEQILNIFSITGLCKILTICDCVEDAEEVLKNTAARQ